MSDCDESVAEGTAPDEMVKILSARKAAAVVHDAEEYVIGSDTVVALDGVIFGKPKDREDAFRMVKALSGKTHTVYTGITVIHGGKTVSACEAADVIFRPLTDAEIEAYVASGEPMDKAGGYGIQGIGAALVRGIKGDFFSVMGLPLCRLCEIFADEFGINLLTMES